MFFADIHWKHDVSQSLLKGFLSAGAISCIVYFADINTTPIIASSLILNAIAVFFMSHSPMVTHRSLFLGHAFSFLSGYLFAFFLPVHILGYALSVGLGLYAAAIGSIFLAVFLMSLFRCLNVPAAVIPFSLVLRGWNISEVVFVALAVTILALLKFLLRPVISDIE
ncbi:MAG: hypothetical protein JW844_06225 [Candidatus Omnitrophica bacterium]|nr:hypothetical protein [Candidatus Omnitrophota bacterium]